MAKIYLNSYEPLCLSKQGREAAKQYDLPPFIDGSCRREPDFEAEFPALSALCRGGIFVPKLKENDIVVYLTKKAGYDDLPPHRRFVAAVKIIHAFGSHEEAAVWYGEQDAALPKNCMVSGNPPVPWEQTHQKPALPKGEAKNMENWDSKYEYRAALHSAFCAALPEFMELRNPPVLTDTDMLAVFADYGRIPITQNPPAITEGDYNRLLYFACRKM